MDCNIAWMKWDSFYMVAQIKINIFLGTEANVKGYLCG